MCACVCTYVFSLLHNQTCCRSRLLVHPLIFVTSPPSCSVVIRTETRRSCIGFYLIDINDYHYYYYDIAEKQPQLFSFSRPHVKVNVSARMAPVSGASMGFVVLFSVPTPPPSPGSLLPPRPHFLSRGSTSDGINQLQQRLDFVGRSPGRLDPNQSAY